MIEHALKLELEAQAGLSALIGDRLYYVTAPQDVAEPYVVFFKVSSVREHSHDGASNLATSRFQFSVFAQTYYEAKLVAAQIQLALQGKHQIIGGVGGLHASITYDNETDMFENNLYHVALEFLVMHSD